MNEETIVYKTTRVLLN